MTVPTPAPGDKDKEAEEPDAEVEDEETPVEAEPAAVEAEPAEDERFGEVPEGFVPPDRPGRQGPAGEFVRVRLPDRKKGELFGIADQLMGGSRLKINCEDGKSRMCRIPGKMKRRMWIREGDLCIIRPWEFQDEKADVVWRYTKTQASYLSRKGLIPKHIDVF